ncbi:MAG: hypothetical protein AB7S80_16845, partial [Rhizobiaceae bacterium]
MPVAPAARLASCCFVPAADQSCGKHAKPPRHALPGGLNGGHIRQSRLARNTSDHFHLHDSDSDFPRVISVRWSLTALAAAQTILVGAIMGWWKRSAFLSIAVVLAGLAAGTVRHAYADGPYLTRTETVLDDPKYFAGQWTITDGAMKLGLNDDLYWVQFNWSQPPAVIDSAGFDITLNVAGQV